MKRLTVFALITTLLVACAPQVDIPTPAPTENVAATAQAVIDAQPEPTERIRTLFDDDQVKVFFRDFDATDQVLESGSVFGYVRGTHLTVGMRVENDRLSNEAGVVYLVPRGAHDLFRFGGVGPTMQGQAEIALPAGDVSFDGRCSWTRTPLGEWGLVFEYQDEAGVNQTVRGAPDEHDFPPHFFYGLALSCTVQVP